MNAYIFNLSGRLAHWRRMYTNTSSLTYLFPTRTSILGIISSILELDYDSYYNLFKQDKLNVAIEINSMIYKSNFILNYRSKKIKGLTQIPLEILFNKDYKLSYIIYLSSDDDEIISYLDKLMNKVKCRNFGYGVYLGQRQYRGDIEFVNQIKLEKLEKSNLVNSVCPKNKINGALDLNNLNKRYNVDLMPVDFDSTRKLKKKEEYVSELNLFEIKVIDGFIDDVYLAGNKYISFM